MSLDHAAQIRKIRRHGESLVRKACAAAGGVLDDVQAHRLAAEPERAAVPPAAIRGGSAFEPGKLAGQPAGLTFGKVLRSAQRTARGEADAGGAIRAQTQDVPAGPVVSPILDWHGTTAHPHGVVWGGLGREATEGRPGLHGDDCGGHRAGCQVLRWDGGRVGRCGGGRGWERLDAKATRPQFPRRLQTKKHKANWTAALAVAVAAARAAGRVMRHELARPKRVNLATQHDIKLALDVQCQQLIQRRLLQAYPASGFFGEEGSVGDPEADWRWVVDPIDGTVNFTYGIPHACVSIALQERRVSRRKPRGQREGGNAYETVVGVVHDPFADELWTAIRGGRTHLNRRPARVSQRARLDEAMVSLGFGKRDAVLQHLLPAFRELTPRVRKLRIMGSAALALTYVATGRFDAYAEVGLGLWDFAAGALIVEGAGGEVRSRELPDGLHEVVATNGRLSRPLRRLLPDPLSA